jgi:cysteine synthase A
VTGFGTGGTLKGVSRVLKRERPDTKIVVCEPDNSPILGSKSPQARMSDGTPAESHPMFRPHLMQGWSPDFIPKLTDDAIAAQMIDRVVPVRGDDALRLSRDLARKEGIFAGISGGATLAGALIVAADAAPGECILCMLPDTGERYLSTPLFDDIPADMTPEELHISRSTPGYRFDVAPPPVAPAQNPPEAPAPASALQFLSDSINDPDKPVTLFALEWCEFCWSVRKMFTQYEIPFRSVDLDSVAYQENNRGGEIRAALKEVTGLSTIPQIFVGGQHVGGATELFDAWKSGQLQKMLEENSVPYKRQVGVDPYSFLPGWLQPR